MKKVFYFAILFVGMTLTYSYTVKDSNTVTTTMASDYCDGWEDGYCEGWKDVRGQYALCPLTPLCPLPELGKDGYRDGYNRGFKKGMRDARK